MDNQRGIGIAEAPIPLWSPAVMSEPVSIQSGVLPEHRGAAARLYWQAFGQKLSFVMGPDRRALAYLDRVMRSDHVITATSVHGTLLAIAGFRTASSGFTAGGMGDLVAVYGPIGARWRAILLWLLSSDADARQMLVDGIVVVEPMRNCGLGSAMIDALCREARERGYDEIRLDVANVNPRARALYERSGFAAVGIDRIGPLAPLFRYSSSTRMVRKLA